MKKDLLKAFLSLVLLHACLISSGKEIVFEGENLLIGKMLETAEDHTNLLTISDMMRNAVFSKSKDETPNFSISNASFWLKFTIVNNSPGEKLLLELPYPLIDSSELYEVDGAQISMQSQYEGQHFNTRKIRHHNIVFEITIPKHEKKVYYLKIKSKEQIIVPLILSNQKGFLESALTTQLLSGMHMGLLMVMILFNMFIYLSIFEKSYLYYVLYILFIGLTQTTLSGYTFKYLWPASPDFNHIAIILFPALGGIFAILFFRNFLHTKDKVPVLNKALNVIIALYVLAIIMRLTGNDKLSFRIIDYAGLTATLLGIGIAAKLSLQDYRPAKFFLLAWTIFLVGIILFVMRNLNILPYNVFTNYTMQAGTDIVVILLSFALADKINILKREEEKSREQALRVSLLNEKIIREQNVFLENKVEERTVELKQTNVELNNTLNKLKDAQGQLIESEKMASLGQLTAGIAHEINNPINFVSSNIRPLKRDINDLLELLAAYDEIKQVDSLIALQEKLTAVEKLKKEVDLEYLKEELDMLLKGMEDGANRTVEIVKGLKIFSRVDESDLNFVNINEGIESTLVILNNQMSSRMKLVKDLGNIPAIECYAGKLNQVFMNILTNSIHAVLDHPETERIPTIQVTTSMLNDQQVVISMKDNGVGMTPEVKAKIFEPFFTTKDVGKGTGLGLSIVFKIIEAHNGTIEVISEVGNGTEFKIVLPVKRH
ncbi:MAG: 7TM diverse intracellular signaling domain-containing protein [Bacteroidota bacterium]